MQLFMSLFPIVLLIWLMVKKNSMPSSQALPLVALILYLVKLAYFESDPNLVHANVVAGLLTAWTPILIVWGAIFLFRTMEHSGAMDTVRRWLNAITTNRVAQLMIVGWAFPFLIEGASGFGTPAALAAPVLVGLGFPVVRVAILCLIMNSVPVSFGAVGTPTWFGFKEIALTNAELMSVGAKTAVIHGLGALIIPVMALLFVVPKKEVTQNIIYVYLSILSCVVPMIVLGFFTYEFPSIIGGLIGLVLSVVFAKMGIGTSKQTHALALDAAKVADAPQTTSRAEDSQPGDAGVPNTKELLKATFPLWGTVLVLILTRIQQLGIKGFLNDGTPLFQWELGSLGTFWMSPSLVVGMDQIFKSSEGWSHKLLFVPSIVPFILISGISFWLFRMSGNSIRAVVAESNRAMVAPVLALLGALVFVKLLMMDGQQANTMVIGHALSDLIGSYWQYGAAFLGALGSFFSGSATISNLTFGGIQDSIAQSLNLDRTTILAMQSVGGAMGNMVCINNIVAVCSVLSIDKQEGYILTRTVWPMLVYGIAAGIMGALLGFIL